MKTAVVLFLAIGCRIATACDCGWPSVEQAKANADVIFLGTITEIAKQTVHFQVARVWKGNVGKVFTMPELRETGACVGFGSSHLRVGNDLLVYASQVKGAYVTDICTRTQFAQDAGEDFVELGLGLPPLELRQSHFLIRALVGIALFGIGTWMLFKWAMQ